MSDLAERVAKLEALRGEDRELLETVLSEIKGVHSEMTRYKGFIGGIAFLASAIGTAVLMFKDWIVAHLK